ncbi:MAG: hypothetical protein HY679_06325 [Chloroflexi bacterium]|nr:hypothetical protein [Chloroflexota bacterium]
MKLLTRLHPLGRRLRAWAQPFKSVTHHYTRRTKQTCAELQLADTVSAHLQRESAATLIELGMEAEAK